MLAGHYARHPGVDKFILCQVDLFASMSLSATCIGMELMWLEEEAERMSDTCMKADFTA